jgi:hypothetical protein
MVTRALPVTVPRYQNIKMQINKNTRVVGSFDDSLFQLSFTPRSDPLDVKLFDALG